MVIWPFHRVFVKREARILRRLVASCPVDLLEAQEKFVYLAALAIAPPNNLTREDIEVAVGTLRPFSTDLSNELFRG